MREKAQFLKQQMKASGGSLDPATVAELVAALNPEALRRIAYAVLDEVLRGNTNKLIEFPRLGPQGELFK